MYHIISHTLHIVTYCFCSKVITQHHSENMKHLSFEQQEKLKRGVLDAEVAKHLPNVSNPQVLINIMDRFDMLIRGEIRMGHSTREEVYIVPCLLQRVSASKVQNRDPKVPSIHFKFVSSTEVQPFKLETRGFLPPGVFHRLVSSCCRTKHWNHWVELMFHDYIELDAEDFCFALHMAHNGITMLAFNFEDDTMTYSLSLTKLREEIHNLIKEILAQMFPNMSCTTFLLHDCCSDSTVPSVSEKSG